MLLVVLDMPNDVNFIVQENLYRASMSSQWR